VCLGQPKQLNTGPVSEARTILDRAVKAIELNKGDAIREFNYNKAPFRDRDLFVFCFDTDDGKFTAHEAFVGLDVRHLRDPRGRPFGEQMYAAAKANEVTEISYMSPFPETTTLVPKHAIITRVADQVCGVSANMLNESTTTPMR
jgi:cytochrome c